MDMMAIGAHPDDIEFGCGGILCAEAAKGRSIVMVDLTAGEMGTHGTPEIRREEALRAAEVIGAKRVTLDLPDCQVFDTPDNRLCLVEQIRLYQPRLVIAQLWQGTCQHPDHFGAGALARYACRLARFRKVLPEIPIHWVEGILHYPGPIPDQVDFLVDVEPHLDIWKEMMQCHASQLQTFDFIDRVLTKAQYYGPLIGSKYAQALVHGNPIVIDDLFAIAKGTREL